MKYLITKRRSAYLPIQKEVEFEFCGLGHLQKALLKNDMVQFDTETSYIDTKKHKELTGRQHFIRELYTLQFGFGEDQYLIDFYGFQEKEKAALRTLFDIDIIFLGHNMAFDYTVVKAKLGATIKNIHDTYLMSRVLNMGTDFEAGYHGLAGCMDRLFGITIPKDEQKSFKGEVMTAQQLEYAYNDVIHLDKLYKELKYLLEKRNVWKVYDEVERKVLAPLCDMSLNRMRFDTKHWKQVGRHLKDELKEIVDKLESVMFSDIGLVEYLKDDYDDMPLISKEEEINMHWASPLFKKLVYSLLVPEVDYKQISTLKLIKDYVNGNKDDDSKEETLKILKLVLGRDYETLNSELLEHHRDTLIEKGYIVPANQSKVNWNSPKHKLKIFNYYYPNLRSTNSKVIAKLDNPLLAIFRKYSKINKSCSTYGENFVKNYVYQESIAPSGLSQILNTGRMASIYQGLLNSDIKVINTVKRGNLLPMSGMAIPCEASTVMLLCA